MSLRTWIAAAALALTSTAALAQSAPVTARIGYIPVIGAAPVFVADREGYLKAGHVELKVTTFESGPNMIQALASGTIDIYAAGVAPLLVAASKGVDLKIVAATAVAENVFASGPALTPFFKEGTSAAQAFKDFRAAKGKPAKLAAQPPGSVPNTTLQYWLWEVAKADKGDVEVIAMGIDATQQALLAQAVDGAIIREPAVSIVTGRNPQIKVQAFGNDLFPGQPGTVLAFSGAFIKQHPQAVQTIVDGLVKANILLTTTPEKAIPHVEALLGKGIVPTATIEQAIKSKATQFEIDPRKIIAATKAMQAFQVKLGSLEKESPVEPLFDASYYEKAAAKK